MPQQQGIPWIVRKVINFAHLELSMKQTLEQASSPDGTITAPVTSIHVTQTVTPGSFNSDSSYVLDGVTREATVPIFGAMSMCAHYVGVADDDEGGEGNLLQRLERPVDGDDTVGLKEVAKGLAAGWTTTTVWGVEKIDGNRHYIKDCTTVKGAEVARARLVYDYKGPPTK